MSKFAASFVKKTQLNALINSHAFINTQKKKVSNALKVAVLTKQY